MSLKFACPHCHIHLSAEPEHYSTQVDCPDCQQPFIVPKPEDIGVAPEDPHVVKFLCPHCTRRLSAVAHQFGTEMPCPHIDCLKPVLVPRPEWKPIPTTLLRSGSVDSNELLN
jgi:hypothetical protein